MEQLSDEKYSKYIIVVNDWFSSDIDNATNSKPLYTDIARSNNPNKIGNRRRPPKLVIQSWVKSCITKAEVHDVTREGQIEVKSDPMA